MSGDKVVSTKAKTRLLCPDIYQQQNLLPWRPSWIQKRHRLLLFGYGLWGVLALCLLMMGYFLHWQRQQQWQYLQTGLQQRVGIAQQQLQPVLVAQHQWLYKQAAMVDHYQWQQASQGPMQQLLLVQNMLRKVNGQVRSIDMDGQRTRLQITTSLSWEHLQTQWWLPESGQLYRVKRLGQKGVDELWLLHVGIAAQP